MTTSMLMLESLPMFRMECEAQVIPAVVKQICNDYLALCTKHTPGLLSGFYLHGSVALGAFDARHSDIDFVAIIDRQMAKPDFIGLRAVHATIARQYPQHPLEGTYLQWSDLGKYPGEAPPHPYYCAKAMHSAGYHNFNAVTWRVLKNRGIAILGPEPQQLAFTVDQHRLISDMAVNLNSYWGAYTNNPHKMVTLLTSGGIEWAVLGVSRLLYTFRQGEITSKIAAGEYALEWAKAQYRPIVWEALAIRRNLPERHYHSRLSRARAALGFLRYAIGLGNDWAGINKCGLGE